jgi:hypothetical protein
LESGAGSGEADEEEAPFFGDIGLGGTEGEEALFAAGQDDYVELQALGGVQGEEGDRFGSGVEGVWFGA